MGIRKYKPTTPGRRGASVSDSPITRSEPEKSLVRPLHGKGGRSATVDHHPAQGRWPQARVPRDRLPSSRQGRRRRQGRTHRVRPEPHRQHRAAALPGRREALHHCAAGSCAGTRGGSGANADIKPGNNLPLRNIPAGTLIHAVELRPGGGAKMARSAGVSIQLLGKEGTYASLRMPSGEIRRVDVRCRATVGEVGNAEQANINWGKAGRMRWKGKRPTVRGVVMNRSTTRTAVARARRPAAGTRSARGASPRAVPVNAISRATSSSSDAGAPARSTTDWWPMPRSLKKGPFVDDHLPEEGRRTTRRTPSRSSRPGRAGRPSSPTSSGTPSRCTTAASMSGFRHRGDGRTQARRVRTHPHVQGSHQG